MNETITKQEFQNGISGMATKEELRAEMSKMATKEELRAEMSKMATKEELRAEMSKMATKEELRDEVSKMVTKEEFQRGMLAMDNRLLNMQNHIDAKFANMQHFFWGALGVILATLIAGIVFSYNMYSDSNALMASAVNVVKPAEVKIVAAEEVAKQ